ncbi:hypothetical protein EB796_000602 [Bugula neritina]|uniref:Uncharacterized protein n=1 Tax=Bugula neritina TaxID=10212 RepID=A0A7J7KSE4_BUGNE|nr:hypothetical protein EB796_000602 [Bugula neritina]
MISPEDTLNADLSSPSASGGEEKESKSSTDVSYQGVTNDIAIEALCKEVWPVLAFVGGLDTGLRVGGRCVTQPIREKVLFLV